MKANTYRVQMKQPIWQGTRYSVRRVNGAYRIYDGENYLERHEAYDKNFAISRAKTWDEESRLEAHGLAVAQQVVDMLNEDC